MSDTGNLMRGKRGLIMGVANNRSIAWGITKACAAQGAEIALTFQGDALKKRVEPLAEEVGCRIVLPCDVSDAASMDAVFAALKQRWGGLDFLVHAIAFSDKAELDGRYVDTSERNFTQTMLISCFSFTALAQRAEKLMSPGDMPPGSMPGGTGKGRRGAVKKPGAEVTVAPPPLPPASGMKPPLNPEKPPPRAVLRGGFVALTGLGPPAPSMAPSGVGRDGGVAPSTLLAPAADLALSAPAGTGSPTGMSAPGSAALPTASPATSTSTL